MLKSRGSIFAALNRLILKGGMRNNHAISIGLACVIAASTILLMRGHLPIFEDIEGSLLDARFQYRGAIPRSELVKIVAIDEKSIDEIGRWPWSREIVAELINKIDDLGAQTIALDIIFSEPQISHYDLLLQDDLTNGLFSDEQRRILEKKAQQTNPDSQLTAAIFMAGKVVNGHYFYHDDVRSSDIDDKGLLISSRVAAVKQKADDFRHINFASVRTNLPNIALAGEGAGYFNQIPDADGVVLVPRAEAEAVIVSAEAHQAKEQRAQAAIDARTYDRAWVLEALRAKGCEGA